MFDTSLSARLNALRKKQPRSPYDWLGNIFLANLNAP